MTYWVLMLTRVGETAGIPMAVFTDEQSCKAEIVIYDEPAEMRWYCMGVIMPASE